MPPTKLLIGPVVPGSPALALRAGPDGDHCRTFGAAGTADWPAGEGRRWADFAAAGAGDWRPDLVLLWLPYTRVPDWAWDAPVPVVGLAGDWNLLWHGYRHLAPRCDAVLTDAPGVDRFRAAGVAHAFPANLYGLGPEWLADVPPDPAAGRDVDVLFVGNLRASVQAERLPWLARLARAVPGRRVVVADDVFGADYRALVRRAKVAFNRSVRGECNQRAFEALAGGALLLQEAGNAEVRHYLRPGVDFAEYGDGDLEAVLGRYLADEVARRAVAAAGAARAPEFAFGRLVRAGLAGLDTDDLRRRAAARTSRGPADRPSLAGRVWAAAALAMGEPDPDLRADLATAGDDYAQGALTADPSAAADRFARAAAAGDRVALAALAQAQLDAGRGPEAFVAARVLADALAAGPLTPAEADRVPAPLAFDALRVAWERAAWEHPADPAAERLAKARRLEARAYAVVARVGGDLAHYSQAAELVPDDPATLAEHGRALARAGRFAEAAGPLGRATALDPFDAAAARAAYQSFLDAGRLADAAALAADRLALHRAAPRRVPSETWFVPVAADPAVVIDRERFAARFGALEPLGYLTGFTGPADTQAVLTLVRSLRPRRVLEVGTADGRMTANLTLVTPADAVVTTIGLTAALAPPTGAAQSHEVPSEAAYGRSADHFGLGHKVRFVRADSRAVDFATFGPLDFAFIDGGHDYDTVRADSVHAYAALRPGGILAWHDYGSGVAWVEVRQAVTSLRFAEPVYRVEGTEVAFLIKGEGIGGAAEERHARLAVAWEGDFVGVHSLAVVNRALRDELRRRGHAVGEAAVGESGGPADATVRHAWPPRFDPPAAGPFVLVQPWEFGRLPREWVEPIRAAVDEVWCYSRAVARCYVASGVPEDRVAVVPLGVDPNRFRPGLDPLPLATRAAVRLLFVGGTIPRKGFDALLAAYAAAFRRADGVCLVVKDMGVGTFYRGQTAEAAVRTLQADPDAPEVEYLDRELADGELPRLYAACGALVHPYRGEGFALPVLEAMACGLPVAATAGGATEDFVPPAAGWRVPARVAYFDGDHVGGLPTAGTPWWLEPDRDALVGVLRDIVADAEGRRRKGAEARRAALGFTWARTAAAVEDRVRLLRARTPARFQAAAAPAHPPRRMRVSLCVIARDEEHNLPACLASVAGLADEVVVVDTGSTDRTREVARAAGARVFDFPWVDDFAAARNASLDRATGDWVFWMDCDDRVDAANRRLLADLFAGLADEAAAYVVKCVCVPDRPGGSATAVDHVRLFRRDPRVRWRYRIHEQILPALRAVGTEVRWTEAAVHHVGYVDPAVRRRKMGRDTALLEKQLADHPDDPFALFNLGCVRHEAGRHAEALAALGRSLALSHPRDSIVRKLYALVAQCHARLGSPDKAAAAVAAGRELYPDDAELLFLDASLHGERGDLDGAAALYRGLIGGREAAHFGSVDTGLRGHKARHNLAAVYVAMRRPREAEAEWRAALAEAPGFAPAALGLGELYLRTKEWSGLERLAGEWAAQGPGGAAEAAALTARMRIERGEFAAARRGLDEALGRFPDAVGLWLLLARACLREGTDPAAAEAALRRVLDLAPDHPEAKRELEALKRE